MADLPDGLVNQEHNNNQKKFFDDLEENMGLLAAHRKGVKSSAEESTLSFDRFAEETPEGII